NAASGNGTPGHTPQRYLQTSHQLDGLLHGRRQHHHTRRTVTTLAQRLVDPLDGGDHHVGAGRPQRPGHGIGRVFGDRQPPPRGRGGGRGGCPRDPVPPPVHQRV